MAAPTNAAKREKSSCQPGAVHTWHIASVNAVQRYVRSWKQSGLSATVSTKHPWVWSNVRVWFNWRVGTGIKRRIEPAGNQPELVRRTGEPTLFRIGCRASDVRLRDQTLHLRNARAAIGAGFQLRTAVGGG